MYRTPSESGFDFPPATRRAVGLMNIANIPLGSCYVIFRNENNNEIPPHCHEYAIFVQRLCTGTCGAFLYATTCIPVQYKAATLHWLNTANPTQSVTTSLTRQITNWGLSITGALSRYGNDIFLYNSCKEYLPERISKKLAWVKSSLFIKIKINILFWK